jgi:hypothetical protein
MRVERGLPLRDRQRWTGSSMTMRLENLTEAQNPTPSKVWIFDQTLNAGRQG